MPTYGSLFTGIGGIDAGLDRAGWTCAWQIEVDPKCVSVLERHWPKVKRYGDIREVDPAGLVRVDALVGGFPCQDLSVAGHRAGLAVERSGLFFEFMRLADAFPAAELLIENVPGLLSSRRGADFAILLGRITKAEPEIPRGGWGNAGILVGPVRSVAWRILDARFFGVAQRRRRVFVVAGPGNGTRELQVLFECKSGFRDSQEGRTKGKVAPTIPASGAGTGRPGGPRLGQEEEYLVETTDIVATLNAGGTSGGFRTEPGEHLVVDNGQGDPNWDRDRSFALSTETPSAVMVVPEKADTLTAGTARSKGVNPPGRRKEDDENLVAFQCHGGNVGEMGTLRGSDGLMSEVPFLAEPSVVHENLGGSVTEAASARSLRAGASHSYQFVTGLSTQVTPKFAEDLSPTLQQPSPSGGGQPAAVAFAENQQGEVREMDVIPSREAGGGKPGSGYPAVTSSMVVRRLTPKECSRLQAFPDDWNEWGIMDGKRVEFSDSVRYRQDGNAVCTSVAWWIGSRLRAVTEGRDPDSLELDIARYIKSLNIKSLNTPTEEKERERVTQSSAVPTPSTLRDSPNQSRAGTATQGVS